MAKSRGTWDREMSKLQVGAGIFVGFVELGSGRQLLVLLFKNLAQVS